MSADSIPYKLVEPTSKKVPFVLSIPHCGVEFPNELSGKFVKKQLDVLDDTDWYLDSLYDFAPSLGVTMIYAKYSRWVIDLNREPGSVPLY
ncbi:MAG: N-formylglutamate deformylase, partial [Pyrinomonadaceae bacterium]|nr:N-formylglutamate deformylase [Pyrinomonadaceae bacterium]